MDKKPRRRHKYRELCFRVNEISELVLAFRIVPGDSHDVPTILCEEVWVLIDERLTHSSCVFLIDTEKDRLLEAVPALLEEFGDTLGDQLRAIVDHERSVEILLVIDPVRHLLALPVRLSLGRAVAVDVDVDVDIDDFVRSEKAILDTLLKGIRVDRRSKVMDIGDVFRFLGSRGQPDLCRTGKVFKNLPPSSVFVRAPAMALVNNDEVEKAGREVAEKFLAFLRTRKGLVEAEVNLVRGVNAALLVERGSDRMRRLRYWIRWSWSPCSVSPSLL